ncbi:putative equilibrative nucleoside transporter [Rosa chinensis]|uniref:Putative equilibrative nucleoside transporter n=1 Tax=Rosa chinensis TaxID=74649 RepID=A0A2P6Q3D8_ROSCH|nr:putative equilibrative nucleoside transporter [Rosa chinensis]
MQVHIDANLPNRLSNKHLFVQNIDYGLDLFLIYALTYSIFPSFMFENTGEHQLGSWDLRKMPWGTLLCCVFCLAYLYVGGCLGWLWLIVKDTF